MGAPLKYIDVGGGLGVDYDGSGRSDSSINYSEQEYANDVVSILQSICDEKKIDHPSIISESGRSLVAHSTALIFDVLGNIFSFLSLKKSLAWCKIFTISISLSI
jgi:arginine decarboxylase